MSIQDTPPELSKAILYANGIYVRTGLSLEDTREEFVKSEYAPLWESVREFLIPLKDEETQIINDGTGSVKQPDPWYSDPSPDDDSYWARYLELLIRKGWKNAINDIRSSTRDLIDRIPDPNGEPLDAYGLVVGRVQSGKTANFTGLMARAADSGYNLIVVMSGTLNNLRDQTAKRLLRELTGHSKHPKDHHVELPDDKSTEFEIVSSEGDDFKGADELMLSGDRPILAVIKKNVDILRKLHKWLSNTTQEERNNLKLLMIDDESDYGSVNTNRKRAATESLQGDEDEVELTKEEKKKLNAEQKAASSTNAYVRGILNLFPTRAYIGYTATPYANVMIDPHEDEAEFVFEEGGESVSLGKTLYPRNFIKELSRPPGYLGLGELFPPHSSPPNVKLVPGTESHHYRAGISKEVKPILKEALCDYVVSGTIKKMELGEKWAKSHHTMMIHILRDVTPNLKIGTLIDTQIKNWKDLIHSDWEDEYEEMISELRDSWKQYRDDDLNIESVRDFMNDIQPTRLVNSESDENVKKADLIKGLDFDSAAVVATVVGGDLLSRGLTLEGLTISYFLRPAGTYDTAIQMCRWNGIRSDLEKSLIRVYLTKEMKENYEHLNVVEEDLREDIRHYAKTGKSPSDFAVRVLMHQVEGRKRMDPTNKAKMAAVVKVDRGIHRTIQQARGFSLDDLEVMINNAEITKGFLGNTDLKLETGSDGESTGHYVARNVPFEDVWKWFKGLKFPERGMNSEGILGYFGYMAEKFPANLEEWSVILVGKGEGSLASIGENVTIRMPTRTRNSEFGIAELVTARHLSVDRPGHPDDFRGAEGKFPRGLMFDERPKNKPTVLIYLLDPDAKEMYEEHISERPDFVVAPAFVLPDMKLDLTQEKELMAYYRLENMPGSGR